MLLPALAFVGGVAIAFQCAALPAAPALAGMAAAAMTAWSARSPVVAGVFAGFVVACLQGLQGTADDWPCSRDRERVQFAGRVTSPGESRPGRVDLDLAPDAEARRRGLPKRIRVSWYEPTGTPWPGDRWNVSAVVRCRNGFANPGGFDRERDLLHRGYGATAYIAGDDAPAILDRQPWRTPVEAARAWVAARIAVATAGSNSTGVLQGLAVGLRGSIDAELREAFMNTGIAHLIAISGMHVTAFAIVTLWASRRAYGLLATPSWSARWPAWQAAGVCAMTAGYGLLAGNSLPTARTVAMVAIALALRVVRRPVATSPVLAASALLLSAADPLGSVSAGFWLSFAAVAALLALVRAGSGGWIVLRRFVRSQAAVTVVLAPVLVAAFGGVPLVGPVVNALAIPMFSILLLPGVLAGMALLPAWPGLSDGVWDLLAALLDRCWPALQWAASLPGGVLRPPRAPWWLVAIVLGTTLAAVALPGRAARWLAVVTLATLFWRPGSAPPSGAVELTVLDVGHGLAVVVQTAGRVLLFDTGPRWRGGGAAASVTVVPFLRHLGIRRVDTVIVSHQDSDHAGGLDVLAQAFRPAWVIGNVAGADEPCRSGRRWSWDGVEFEILHPPRAAGFDGNDGSCAVLVRTRGFALLLLADPESRAEQAMQERGLRAEAVIVPHHGSATSSTAGLVRAISPRWALVSSGFGNRWGLPRPEVVARWRAAGAEVATTAAGGALSLRLGPDGHAGPLRQWRRDEPRWWRRGACRDVRGTVSCGPHVGDHSGRRPGDVADHPLLRRGGGDHSRAPVDAAGKAGHTP